MSDNLDLSTVADLADALLRKLDAGQAATLERVAEPVRDDSARRRAAYESARLAEEERAIRGALPPVLRGYGLTGSDETPAVKAVRTWLDGPARGLMLRGPAGVGKSVAAAVALSEAVRRGARSVSWHRPNDFVSAVLHSYDESAPRLGRQFVVIDDIGRETKSEFEEAMCAFIDDTDTRFVVTTNVSREALRERYDERFVSRLNDCMKAATIKGASLRKNNGVI